jgi:DNA-binding MarR family transcriptional regulator
VIFAYTIKAWGLPTEGHPANHSPLLLGELGATWSRDGRPLLPIGTLYDPFVNRAGAAEDRRPLVDLDALDGVGVVAEDRVGSRIDDRVREWPLILGKLIGAAVPHVDRNARTRRGSPCTASRRSGAWPDRAVSPWHAMRIPNDMAHCLPMAGERKVLDPIEEARRHWQARWSEDAATAMVAVTSVMRVQQILMSRLNELLAPLGLTFPRYEALMLLYLSSQGSFPLGRISDRLQVHRTSITGTIDGLEQLGYVTRVRSDHDRRSVLASILPAGRRVAEQATELLNESAFATGTVSLDDLESLTEMLRTFRVDAGDIRG